MGNLAGTVRDNTGQVVSTATVTVYDNNTSVLRDIFSDSGLTLPKANPFNTDTNGYFQFYTASGNIRLKIEKTGFATFDKNDIPVTEAVDHGGMGGLGDDDHPQYSLVDGTRAFTGVVSGVDGTLAAHLATKGQMDTADAALQTQIDGNDTDIAAIQADYIKKDGSVAFTGRQVGVAAVAGDELTVLSQINTDHGLFSGLLDDDHPQYSLADGTRAFNGAVEGVAAVSGAGLTTRDQVDSRIASVGASSFVNITGDTMTGNLKLHGVSNPTLEIDENAGGFPFNILDVSNTETRISKNGASFALMRIDPYPLNNSNFSRIDLFRLADASNAGLLLYNPDVLGNVQHALQSSTLNTYFCLQGGNFGIGLPAPTSKLHVSGTFHATGAAQLGSTLALTGALTTALTANLGAVINETGADSDTRIEGDTNQNLVFVDASTDRVGFGTATPQALVHAAGAGIFDQGLVINETGADSDTRIETDTDANFFYIDAGNNRLGIRNGSFPRCTLQVTKELFDPGAFFEEPVATFISAAAAGDDAIVSIIAGNQGESTIHLADTNDQDKCEIYYDHNAEQFNVSVADAVTKRIAFRIENDAVVRGIVLSAPGPGIGQTAANNGTNTLSIFNGTAPTSGETNGVVLYSEDVAASAELKVRDEAANVTTLSPHNIPDVIDDPTIEYPWAFHHRNEYLGLEEWVNMAALARAVEQLAAQVGVQIPQIFHQRRFAKEVPDRSDNLPPWLLRRLVT